MRMHITISGTSTTLLDSAEAIAAGILFFSRKNIVSFNDCLKHRQYQ